MSQSGSIAPSHARGRLKVFLGYASGVGKSFRMFDEGRRRRERGQDVVVGALQPHVPAEVKPLLDLLEIVPTLEQAGAPVMDVAAILKRSPQVCLVDGLAYDNPQPSRNAHRWQDVEELLAAGINVVASVNLQYIGGQREAVESITGKRVSQSVPRDFLNTADEVTVVDAPCQDASAELMQLREMALLLSADVIDSGFQHYLQSHAIKPPWPMKERLLIYITPLTNPNPIISAARRSAAGFHCDVSAVYLNQPQASAASQHALEKAISAVRAAGLSIDALEGEDPLEMVVQYARAHGVTQILVSHAKRRGWLSRWFDNPLSRLIQMTPGMDVRVIPQ